jgi:LysM repeat protein
MQPPTTSTTVPAASYVIQPGDTLSDIAARFGVSAAQIVALNRLSNPRLIIGGQTLLIPAAPASTTTATTATPDPATTTTANPPPTTATTASG